MPAPAMPNTGNFRDIFKHPIDPQAFGVPIVCHDSYPIQERGCRRQWRYVIGYAKRYINSKDYVNLEMS
jgi:hypothetical protein